MANSIYGATKAERIYRKTRYECKKSIQTWGYRINPDGNSIGFNTVFNEDEGAICTRTLNEMDKQLARDRKTLELDRRLGIGDEERNTLTEQTLNMVETTIRNAREQLANW